MSSSLIKNKPKMYYDSNIREYVISDYFANQKKKIMDSNYVSVPTELILISSFLLLSVPVKKLLKMNHKIFESVGLKFMLITLAIPYGVLNAYQRQLTYFTIDIKIFPGHYYNVFLPIVIFYISHEADFHILSRCWHQILIIGVLRYIIDATLVGLIMSKVIVGDWIITETLLFGFVVTPIAPFGNVDNMKRLSKFKHIGCLLDYDALLGYIISNMVIMRLMEYMTQHESKLGIMPLWWLLNIIYAILLGLAVGKIACFIMNYFHNNPFCAVLLTLVLTIFTYNICEVLIGIPGPVTVLILGFFIGLDRPKYSADVNAYLTRFWSASFYLWEISLLFMMSATTVEHMVVYQATQFYIMIITYLTAFTVRLATYLMFIPILSRLGYGLNIRCTLALSLAANKDVINMLCANMLLYYSETFHVGIYCISHVYMCVLLSHLCNNSRLNHFLKIVGLTEVSTARKVNMDHCMRHIMNKRNRYIASLKTNRYLSDANWSVVDIGTLMKHPYGQPISQEDADDDWSNRKAQCPDCGRIFFVELTEKEKLHVKREIFQCILKSQKISFIRQLGEGMLSKDANTILQQALEVAEESADCIINNQELFKNYYKTSTMHFLKRCLSTQNNKRRELYHTPRKAYRRFLHNIVSSMYFEISIYVFIVLSCVPVIYDIIMHLDETSIIMYWINLSYLFVFVIYWLEFTVKVLAYSWVFISDGLRSYFRSIWNNIDFSIIIMATIDVTISVIHYLVYGHSKYFPERYFDVVRAIRLLRLIRLLTIFRGLIPKVVQYLDGRIEVKLALGFDIGKGLMVSYEDVLNALDQIVGDATLQNEVKARIEQLNQDVFKDIMQVTKDRSWIAIAVKTKQCIRSVLKHLIDGIKYLRRSGNIDDLEYSNIITMMDRNNERLNYLKQIPPASPKVLFNEILWMNANNQVIEFLFNYAEVITFEKDEIIFEEGQKADGIYLVIEGLAHLSSGAKSDSDSIESAGKLPIIDYMSHLRFDDKLNELIMRGNTFGELSVLTDRPYSCTIYTDDNSSCKCYYISTSAIREAFNLFKDPVYGLMSQMWKYSTLQLSLAILQEIPTYQLMPINDIKTHLVRAFVADLSNFHNFIFIELIEDLILLDGKIMDENNRTIYLAPSYIPRSVRRLVKPDIDDFDDQDDGLLCKILIIPMEDVNEYDIIEKIEETATMVDMFAVSLVTGTEVARKSKRQKKKVNKFRHRTATQKNIFGGLRNQLENVTLFDEEALIKQMQANAHGRKTSIFFTQNTAIVQQLNTW